MSPTTPVKLALVTDIHHGIESGSSIELLEEFCNFANDYQPDMVIDLGDRLSDVDHATDLILLQQVSDQFKRLSMPRAHLLGNHDHPHLSVAENADILDSCLDSQVIPLNGYNLILWQANTRGILPNGLDLHEEDLLWLQAALNNAQGPCIVFSHVPLDSGSMVGSYHFEQNQRFATYPQAAQARQIIQASGKVMLCLSGHVHWNSLNHVGGIPHLVLQSIKERNYTNMQPCCAWGTLEIGPDIRWQVYGKNPMALTLPLPGPERRWQKTPLGPGFSRPADQRQTPDLKEIEAVILDLDGVLYEQDHALPGGKEMINYLRKSGRDCIALTNNAQHSTTEFSVRLKGMGIDLPPDKILTSSLSVARQLTDEKPQAQIHVLGSKALRQALLDAGARETDSPDYVIIGWDNGITLDQLKLAVKYLLAGAELIATNADALIPTPTGSEPENGALVGFMEGSTGCKARVCGKPNPIIFNQGLKILGSKAATTLMVGDTLNTDILGAGFAGLPSVYIDRGDKQIDTSIQADMTVANLHELLELFQRADSTTTS